MKHLKIFLSFALALALCLSLAACGESNEDYGDDGSDYNFYGLPDSFEGLVKDAEQMSNLYVFGGAWRLAACGRAWHLYADDRRRAGREHRRHRF